MGFQSKERIIPFENSASISTSKRNLLPIKVAPMMNISKSISPRSAGMNRLKMMRQVNAVTTEQQDDIATISKNRKERRAADMARRKEIRLMENEDYTYTEEGAIRLKRWENRLLMQAEELYMRKVIEFQNEKERKEIEKKKERN